MHVTSALIPNGDVPTTQANFQGPPTPWPQTPAPQLGLPLSPGPMTASGLSGLFLKSGDPGPHLASAGGHLPGQHQAQRHRADNR